MAQDYCKESDSPDEMKKRSKKMVDMFKFSIGKPMQNFPAPPFTKWLNGTVLDVKRGEVEIEYEVRPEMANPTGLLHGGMQTSILDECIGIACLTLGHEGFIISIDMHIDFLGKVKVGETVVGRGEVVREGKKIVNAKAELKDKRNEMIAVAQSNLLITSYKSRHFK